MDGFEDVTDLLCKSVLKKASPKDSWTPFAPGLGTGQLGTEGPYSLHLYSPFVVILLLKLSISFKFLAMLFSGLLG